MWPFVALFLCLGIGLVVAGRKMEAAARKAQSWPSTEGHLEVCEVVERPGMHSDDQSSWHLNIRYSYIVRGVTHRSEQYAFGYGDGRDDAKHRAVVQELRSRPTLVVRYNPSSPDEAVISTEPQENVTRLGYAVLAVAGVSFFIVLVTC